MSRRNGTFIGRILKEAGIVARGAFQGVHKNPPSPKRRTGYVRFIYKGNYYRRPIPTNKEAPPELLKLPPAGQEVMPQPFKTPSSVSSSTTAEALVASNRGHHGAHSKAHKQTWSWTSWWKLNGPLLVLNFGSLATLIGFTRTDVLELRVLSVTGRRIGFYFARLVSATASNNMILYIIRLCSLCNRFPHVCGLHIVATSSHTMALCLLVIVVFHCEFLQNCKYTARKKRCGGIES